MITKTIKKQIKKKHIYTGTILKWIDGDSLVVSVDLGFKIKHKIRIRLERINAWELKNKSAYRRRYAKHCRAYAKKTFPENTGVTIITNKKDRYGRWLAEVYSKGINISERFLESKEKGFEKWK